MGHQVFLIRSSYEIGLWAKSLALSRFMQDLKGLMSLSGQRSAE